MKFYSTKKMKTKIGNSLLWVAAVALIGYLFVTNNRLKEDAQSAKQRTELYKVANDSLRTTYNKKTGEYESERLAYIAEKRALTEALNKYDKDLVALRKKGAVTGGKVGTETRIDTIVVTEYPPNDSTTRIAKVDAMPHYTAEVRSTPDSTAIQLKAYVTLKYGIIGNKVSVSYNNPYVTVTNASGFLELPKQKKSKFWLGVGVGAAAVTGALIIAK